MRDDDQSPLQLDPASKWLLITLVSLVMLLLFIGILAVILDPAT
jgi:hypothetical protein